MKNIKTLDATRQSENILLFLCTLLFITACSHTPKEILSKDYAVVRVKKGDTCATLSEKYLKDPSMGWFISEFNQVENLNPGQEVIIPMHPFRKGGLWPTGYQTIPVLCYNRFSENWSGRRTVTRSSFDSQMRYLKENGYHPITLNQLTDFLQFKAQIPENAVLITIDDGWSTTYTIAYPILRKYNFSAILFIYTDLIDTNKALTWKQLKKMQNSGIDIQCKAKTRRNLADRKKSETFNAYVNAIENEIIQSSAEIKKNLNSAPSSIAYPLGDHNNLVRYLLQKNGFQAGFTLESGENPFFINKYDIHRSVIYGKDDLDTFKKKLVTFHKSDLK